MPDYGDADYWRQRYSCDPDGSFEWLQSYESLRPVVQPFLRKDAEILVVGCGNSSMSEDIYRDGYRNVTSIDSCAEVVSVMADRNASKEEMEYSHMDVCHMEYPADVFDVVLDKATLDSMLCGEEAFHKVHLMMKEIFRVLRPGGVFVCVSYGVPAARLGYLEGKQLKWKVDHVQVDKPPVENFPDQGNSSHHHVYICRKPS